MCQLGHWRIAEALRFVTFAIMLHLFVSFLTSDALLDSKLDQSRNLLPDKSTPRQRRSRFVSTCHVCFVVVIPLWKLQTTPLDGTDLVT